MVTMITIYELMNFSGFFMKKNLHELDYQSFHLNAQSREASVIITEKYLLADCLLTKLISKHFLSM